MKTNMPHYREVVTMTRKGRVTVIVLCIVAGILIVATVGVRLILTRERLLTLVVPRIEKRVGAKIRIGDIGVRFPFGFGVDVKDLVFDKQLPDSSILSVATESVIVKASLVSLIRRRPEIDRVDIRGGDISLTGTPRRIDVRFDGLEADLSVRPVREKFEISARASIESVTLARPASGETAKVRDIAFQGRMESDAAFQSLRIEETAISWGDLVTVRISGDMTDLRGERLLAFHVESRDTRVAPLIETVLALGLDKISYRARSLGMGEVLPVTVTAGTVGFDAKIAGSAREPLTMTADGTLELAGVEIVHGKLGQPVRIDGIVAFSNAGLRSEDLTCVFGRSSAKVGFDVVMAAETRSIESVGFSVDADLDVSELAALAEQEGVTVSGRVHASVQGKGRPETMSALFPADRTVPAAAIADAWDAVTLNGTVRLEDIGMTKAGNPLAVSDCDGGITVAGGDIERVEVGFNLNGSPYTLSGSMRGVMPAVAEMNAGFDRGNPPRNLGAFLGSMRNVPHVSMDLRGRSLDIRPFERAAEKKAAQKKAAQKKVAEQKAAGGGERPAGGGEESARRAGAESKEANPLAANPLAPVALHNTVFTAHIDSLIATKALLTDIDARGTIKSAFLKVDPVTMHYAGGTGSAVLDADMRNPRRIETKMQLSFEGVDAGLALKPIRDVGNLIEGNFSFSTGGSFFISQAIDPLMTLTAKGSATSNRGRINIPQFATPISQAVGLDLSWLERFEFSEWIGGFIIREGRMFTDDWKIRSKNGDWAIRGSFGFDGTLEYVASLVIPPSVQKDMKDLSKYRDLVDLFRDEKGNIVLDFDIGGEAKSPKVKLDRTRAKQKAGEKLIDELKKKAKGLFDK